MAARPQKRRPIRFGVMCGGTIFPAWEARCLEKLLALDGVEPALLIVNDDPPPRSSPRQKLKRLLRGKGALWRLYVRLVLDRRSKATQPVELTAALGHVPVVRCRVERRGKFSEYFDPADIAEIRTYDLDFVLRFGFNIIRGEILTVPRYGVWSFHHDDVDRYRGAPPCFWEIYHRDPVTGSILQRLTDRLDGGVVLHRGAFRTVQHSYVRSRDDAFFGSADWPARVCKDIQNGRAHYLDDPPSPTTAPIYLNPSNRQMARQAFNWARSWLQVQSDSLFRREKWNVGILDAPIHVLLDEQAERPPVRWLPAPPHDRFLADAFAVRSGDEGRGVTLLAEDYDWRTRSGQISAIESPDGHTFGSPQGVMGLPVHMSYPYLLEHEGRTYCVPETCEARQVGLYRAESLPHRWTHVSTLLQDFAAVDSTVFHHQGRWWLFCTDEDGGPHTKLHAWHAPELTGPWLPHEANPLKTDIRSSRPAGTPFVHDGQLYRPAQDCSVTYGGAVTINQVVRLTTDEFEERPAAVVRPDAESPYRDGMHTICALGDRTVVDGKRLAFVPIAFRSAMWAKLGRLKPRR